MLNLTSPQTTRKVFELLKLLGLSMLYSLASSIVTMHFNPAGGSSIFFLASGIALAALLIGGKRYFWAVFLGAFISSILIGDELWMSAAKAFGNALAALIGAWLIRRDSKFEANLSSLQDVTRIFVWGGLVGTAASAIIGTTTSLLSGVVIGDNYLASLFAWWMGDALGVLLITPMILVWWPTASTPPPRFSTRILAEAALILLIAVLVGSIVTLEWRPAILPIEIHWFLDKVSQGYWMFLVVTLAAVRLGMRGMTITLLLVTVIDLIGFYQGTGYFGLTIGHMVSFWYFTVALVLVGMTLTTHIAANKTLTQSLLKSEAAISKELKNVVMALDQHTIVTIADKRGKITYANDKCCAITGYSRGELLGQSHDILNSDMHPHGFFKAMYRTLIHGGVWHGEICNRAKDGHLFWEYVTIVPFIGDKGKPERYVALRTDITNIKLKDAELERYRNHLEELVKEKTQDLHNSVEMAKNAMAELKQQKFVLDQHAIVTMCDIDGFISYGNDRFSQISGFSRDEFMGKNHNILASGHHTKDFFNAMYATISKGKTWHGEICNKAKDGHIYWVDSTISAFMEENGKPREYIAVSTDITEHKRVEAAAHAASRAKSEFLANMSHEIRTPMNGVVGMVDILQKTKLTVAQHRMLGTVHNSSLALLQILNDILDSAKIEAGKLAMESIPTNLREVVEGAAQLMVTVSNAKSIELSVFVSPDLPCWIASDPTRLRQVLLNLLGNAVKFTSRQEDRPSRVMLHVVPCTLTQGRPGIQLCITDNGIGMSQEVLANLFQPFSQADESTARKFGGTGLGLSISQRLVELMDGSISVSSTLGEGAEFTVKLPLLEVTPEHAPVAEPSLVGVHVLAVSCDTELGRIVSAYCIAAGARVSLLEDMAAAREQLQQVRQSESVTVVLLGSAVTAITNKFNLPATIGVARLVTRDSGSHSAKDVKISAHPLLYHDLIHGIALAGGRLDVPDIPEQTERRTPLTRTKPSSVEEALLAGRLILLAEDNETNREVMLAQLNLLGYTAEVAEDGIAALEMWRSGSYTLLLTDCHMPNMDGFELTAAIRQAEPEGSRLPIIAVTANAMQGEFQRCLDLGMDDYLSKPLRLKELKSMLDKWLPPAGEITPIARGEAVEALSINHANEEIESKKGQDETSPDFPAVWDSTTLSRLVGDNPTMHHRLLEKFLCSAQEQVAAIGSAAVTGETNMVGDIAHKLKSAARTVGAIQLGELCQQLETAGRAGDEQACNTLVEHLGKSFYAVADVIKERTA